MSFNGLEFIFDKEISTMYGLKIMKISGNGVESVDGGSNVEIFNDTVPRNPTKYNYGTSQSIPLSFQMEVMSDNPIIGINRSKIEKWLFGKMELSKLQIIQDDLRDYYFNCYLKDNKTTYIGNVCYGFSFTVQCDAPWAWQFEKNYVQKEFEEDYEFYNYSDDNDYTYPVIEIKMKSQLVGVGNIKITNKSDNNRETIFTQLKANELITIDNRMEILSSSEGRLLSNSFNKKFFRLLTEINILNVDGEIEYFKIKYKNAVKIGG